MLTGVNVEQTCAIARETGLKVTASGGVSSLEDISRLRDASECGIDSVIVGKALYEGRFSLREAIDEGSSPSWPSFTDNAAQKQIG
jgi:phosphoribosylformimino-5-aminoimidazole carboxamide ribotide isomerase